MTCILKAFAKRFDFDSVRISQIQTDCQFRSNGKCPVGWLYIIMYIYTIQRGAFVLLVSDNPGNAKALQSGASNEHRLHVLFYVCPKRT